ncbi:MAG: response regulator [Bdellovibrionaceae bacterium]|nr:response regulator [Pseudobdellovibrionaceae bacterium]
MRQGSPPNYRLSILVVDDDAMVRTVLVEYLVSFGFKNILQAKNVPQAIKYLQDPKVLIDIILSDWEMPGAKGLELLKVVRKSVHRKNTPFIMITSQESIERFKITQAAQWRVTEYMVKPFTSDLLRMRIWKVMNWIDEIEDEAI